MRTLGEGAKGAGPFTYKKLPQTPNPLRLVAPASRQCIMQSYRASCKTDFSVILNEVKDLNRLKKRDSSLHSE
jgi:hypothetical protein